MAKQQDILRFDDCKKCSSFELFSPQIFLMEIRNKGQEPWDVGLCRRCRTRLLKFLIRIDARDRTRAQ